MAFTSLGVRNLAIGGAPKIYDQIEIRGGFSYILVTSTTIEVPSNLYSLIKFTFLATTEALQDTFLPQTTMLEPIVGRQSIELVTPPGLPKETFISIYAERVPKILGGGDTAGEIETEILYDVDLAEKL